MPNNINTGRLDQLIREKYTSNAEFARASGVSRQYITEVLRGRLAPSLDRVIAFADLLGVCIDDLVIRNRD
jgi:transcriptional regulator with XRE-family HTH domain